MKGILKAFIVDDERLARQDLSYLLSFHSEIELIGEASSVQSAIEHLAELRPDVLFLDIQMPDESGFHLLDRIEVDFAVVFVTAFDNFALRAFEVNALDYLLKPVSPARLSQTIERLLRQQSEQKLKSEAEERELLKRSLSFEDHVFVKGQGRIGFVQVNTITYLEAMGNYTEIHTIDGNKRLVFRNLKDWETVLPKQYFMRIHRGLIVNLKWIERVESWFNGSMQVFIKGVKEPLLTSRRYATKLRDMAI
jgi:two-component system, LytTR family, response regulator